MKKTFYLLLFSFVISNSYSQINVQQNQTNVQTNINTQPSMMAKGMDALNEQKKLEGMFYLGNGQYTITKVGGSGFVSLKKLTKRCNEAIQEFADKNNYTYEITNVQEFKQSIGVFPKIKIDFNVKNYDGSLVQTKEEKAMAKEAAKKEILELKQYLELGVITQEEYDTKLEKLKKVILSDD